MDEAAARPGGRALREGPLLAAWAVITIVLAALVLVRAEQRAVDDPVQRAARGEVTGLSALSLMRAPRLEQSIAVRPAARSGRPEPAAATGHAG